MMQLHKALLAQGVDSRIITMKINPEDANDPLISVVGFDDPDLAAQPDEFADKVGAMVEVIRKRDRLPTSSPYSRLRLEKHPFVQDADVVHLHWVSNMVDLQTFFRNIDKPVIWTIRDENPMMGFYHYGRDIPLCPSREEKIMDAYLRTMKRESIMACGNLTLVSLCSEMREILQNDAIGRGRIVRVIPNSVNGEVFRRTRRDETRAWYAISPDETVLFFAAQALSEKRKGLAELFDALKLLVDKGRKFTVLCAGNGKPPCEPPPGVRIIIAGFVSDSEKLSALYSAADVFAAPSFAETFGKTMAESLACGTPVGAFPNHGARDVVEDGKDGFISDAFNPYAYARALEKCLDANFDPEELHRRVCARFSPDSVAAAHLQLYSDLATARATSPGEQAAVAETKTDDGKIAQNRRPKLSIITIAYNNAAGLRQTLRSTLCDQLSFSDFEQIVVDGGSTDGTADVIAEYKDRLAWWCSEKDEGIYNAMNKGAMHARGEYLLFLNSGDLLKTDMLAEVFREPFDEELVYSDIYTFKPSGIALSHAADIEELTPGWFLYNTLPHQAMLIKKSLHDRLGGYDETMKISAAPKFAFQSVIEEKCSIRKLPCPFSVYDCSGISSQPRYMLQKFKERERFLAPYYGQRVTACAWQWSISRLLADPDMLMMLGKKTEIAPALKAHVRECLKNPALFQKPAAPKPPAPKPAAPKPPAPKPPAPKPPAPKPPAPKPPAPQAPHPASGATAAEIRNLKARLRSAEFEVADLKRSTAYRTGMFVTWPMRKAYRMLFCRKSRKGK